MVIKRKMIFTKRCYSKTKTSQNDDKYQRFLSSLDIFHLSWNFKIGFIYNKECEYSFCKT